MPAVSAKQATLDLVRRLDDDVTFEQIQYELYVLEKVERGLHAAEAGDTLSREEARSALARWLDDERG